MTNHGAAITLIGEGAPEQVAAPTVPLLAMPTKEEAEAGIRTLLAYIGENPDREGVLETPKRFVKALAELTRGLKLPDPSEHLKKAFTLADSGEEVVYDEMIISRAIPFVSLCEHHLLPFTGKAYIGYLPAEGGKVVGLSKLARLAIEYAARPQVQERLTAQIARAIQTALAPRGVGVVIEGKHTCQCLRGVRADGSMVTSTLFGAMKENPATRSEFLGLCRIGEQ